MLQNLAIQIQALYRIKIVQSVLKMSLLLILGLILYWQTLAGLKSLPLQDLQTYWQSQFHVGSFICLILVVLLMPLNWGLETKKWVALMQAATPLPFHKAMKAVLAGISVSMFTPNRVGEYGGRILMVSSEHRLHGVFATIIGSMSQWMALIGGGLIGLFCLYALGLIPAYFQYYGMGVLFLGSGALLFVSYMYFNLAFFVEKAIGWRLTRKWALSMQKNMLLHYSQKELANALFLSIFRYAVYTIQYFCLLWGLGFECGMLEGWAALSFVFLLQTGLPIPPSMGLLMRGSLAVWVFGWLLPCTDTPLLPLQTAVLAATFLLWSINVLLPALLGSIFIMKALDD